MLTSLTTPVACTTPTTSPRANTHGTSPDELRPSGSSSLRYTHHAADKGGTDLLPNQESAGRPATAWSQQTVADRPGSGDCADTSLSFAVTHNRVSSCSTIYLAGIGWTIWTALPLSLIDGSNDHVLNGAVLALRFARGRHCQWSRSAKPGGSFCSVIDVWRSEQ